MELVERARSEKSQRAGSGTRATLQGVDVGEDLIWTDPEWLAETHEWIMDSLDRAGLTLMGPIEQPHVRPWATALRLPTAQGVVWFKAAAPPWDHEAAVLRVVGSLAPSLLPTVLASYSTSTHATCGGQFAPQDMCPGLDGFLGIEDLRRPLDPH